LNANQQVSMHRPWRIPQARQNSGLGQRTRGYRRDHIHHRVLSFGER
jgi:hypothetical protein